MWFCPLDGTLLQITTSIESSSSSDNNQSTSLFLCPTCPYCHPITTAVSSKKIPTNRKQVDDILGGASAWENVDRTATVCPKCTFGEAYFKQMQLRSADEPMSVFYKCVSCAHQWMVK